MMLQFKRCFFPCLIFLVLSLSCSRTPLPPPVEDLSANVSGDLKNLLVGTWWSDEIVVGIDTIFNSETSATLEIGKEDWSKKLNIRPIQTIFNPNKTYVSAYCNMEGEIIRMTAGKWNVEKNQLKIHQLFPDDQEMKYRIDLSSGWAELRSKLDFDGDGKSDDLFYCQMKKIG